MMIVSKILESTRKITLLLAQCEATSICSLAFVF
uniref:Uncharacterized protein n=1 Tax=Rhizophora mucronata TaxID=61149 RepID=A0A2P2QBV6_RHIMU